MKRLVYLAALSLALVSCKRQDTFSQSFQAPIGDIRALYIQIGNNMWCDWPTQTMGSDLQEAVSLLPERKRPDLYLTTVDSLWRKVTDHAAQYGINMLVVDLGEGLQYPSHPELAIEGSWSVEKMRSEIKRLNDLGIEVIPKLNFSNTHNGWMKDYRHMVSSVPYYQMCSDVISDVMDIFGHPRFFHIGYDEETEGHQRGFSYRVQRVGESWWRDFLFIVGEVEKHGARPWVWSDYGWNHPDYFERCPKSVIQQNWYYDEQYGGFDPETNKTSDYDRLVTYWKLEEAGFDQVPCGTNWVGSKRRELGVGADDVIGKLIPTCRKAISKEHLYGFMMAPWSPCSPEGTETQLRGIDLFMEALLQ
ncbi:MAG: Tat pathway signal protein [Bacteroidales bacterium]|nr:Tat pathway signal protein [Bacteroidales bacterium]